MFSFSNFACEQQDRLSPAHCVTPALFTVSVQDFASTFEYFYFTTLLSVQTIWQIHLIYISLYLILMPFQSEKKTSRRNMQIFFLDTQLCFFKHCYIAKANTRKTYTYFIDVSSFSVSNTLWLWIPPRIHLATMLSNNYIVYRQLDTFPHLS